MGVGKMMEGKVAGEEILSFRDNFRRETTMLASSGPSRSLH